MPQTTYRVEERDGICQSCLERELGNWFEEDIGPEVMNMANNLFGDLSYNGKCVICGSHIDSDENFSLENIYPSMMFDCISERLEIEDYREKMLDHESILVLN